MNLEKNRLMLKLSTQILAAYVSNHTVPAHELMDLFQTIHSRLLSLDAKDDLDSLELTPAVPIEESILSENLVCLEDGKKFKLLKRHLATTYNMSPEEYRSKWGLPPDYPMVAPSYSQKRRQLAKISGLGTNK